jgi:hypothetical protein
MALGQNGCRQWLDRGSFMPKRRKRGASDRAPPPVDHVSTRVPGPWTDSRGRLVGNLIAMWDLLRGRCRPERVRNL